jgi:hypothetical protein
MPVGQNHPVKRFVKGHMYKIYKPNTPDRYYILRFRKKIAAPIFRSVHQLQCLGNFRYEFILIADNLLTRFLGLSDHQNPVRGLSKETISSCTVEELRLDDLPRYVGAKYVAPEFERILKGEPIYKRKFSKIPKKPGKWVRKSKLY